MVGFEPSSELGCRTARPFGPLGGNATAPVAARLHAALSRAAQRSTLCQAAARPAFYRNESALGSCDFPAGGGAPLPAPAVADSDARLRLAERLRDRTDSSFLFEDAELWDDEPRVVPARRDPQSAPAPAPALLAGERDLLAKYAPWLLRALHRYEPSRAQLRELLAREAALRLREPALGVGAAAARAAGELARTGGDAFRDMRKAFSLAPHTERYRVLVYLCLQGKPWPAPGYRAFAAAALDTLQRDTLPQHVDLQLESVHVDCRSKRDLSASLVEVLTQRGAYRVLGAAVCGAGVPQAAQLEAGAGLALVSYDVQPELAQVPSAAPGTRALAGALRAALAACGWRRAALLSEDTPAGHALEAALEAALGDAEGELRAEPLARGRDALERQLRSLTTEYYARVFVLNAGAAAARDALELAAQLELTPERGYAWLAREWEGPEPPPLTLLAPRPGPAPEPVPELWGARPPARAGPLMLALRTLALGFTELFARNEELRYDHLANDTRA